MVLALKSYDGGENRYQSSRGCSFIVLSLGEHGLAPDWQVCVLNESFAFVIVYRFARWRGFRPAGRLTFFSREKSKQKRLPLHTALRCAQGSFASPLLQGPAYKGRPWPFKPLAASMRLAPLRNGSTHPPERGGWCRLWVRTKKPCQRHITILQATRTPLPVSRRPSGGVAQGDARHGRRARSEGTGTSLRDGPRSSTGAREVWPQARPGCRARFLFGYFLFRASKEKVTRPGGRNQKCQHTR